MHITPLFCELKQPWCTVSSLHRPLITRHIGLRDWQEVIMAIPIHALSIEVNFPSKFMKDDLYNFNLYTSTLENILKVLWVTPCFHTTLTSVRETLLSSMSSLRPLTISFLFFTLNGMISSWATARPTLPNMSKFSTMSRFPRRTLNTWKQKPNWHRQTKIKIDVWNFRVIKYLYSLIWLVWKFTT